MVMFIYMYEIVIIIMKVANSSSDVWFILSFQYYNEKRLIHTYIAG